MEGDGIRLPSATALVWRGVRGPLVAAAIAVAAASVGYVLIDEWSWFDAVYMAVITVFTVGYGEIDTLSNWGRLWTMGVILAGFTVFVYSAASITALIVAGDIKAAIRNRRRAQMREHLSDHVIVAGFGRVGRAAAEAALRGGSRCEVIDTDAGREEAILAMGAVFLCGDARDATVLRHAGVNRAAALIISLDDPSNAVVALTARSMAPGLRVVSRVTDLAWRNRLLRAGVSEVVPVYESVGTSLAAVALDAEVRSVVPIAGTDMRVEEVEVGANSRAEGLDLRGLMDVATEVHILGLRRDTEIRRWHEAGEPLCADDVLVVMGSSRALGDLNALLRRDSRVEA